MVKEEQMKKEIESIDTKNTDEKIVIKGSKTYLFFKRVLDIVVSFISIVFLMATLIFPIISVLVLISTRGQVIFKDERMGINKNSNNTCGMKLKIESIPVKIPSHTRPVYQVPSGIKLANKSIIDPVSHPIQLCKKTPSEGIPANPVNTSPASVASSTKPW